ncbi:MAG: YlmC/YmxH family sporulation protein [Clostridiales bacterium]|nr:YlmC/YmxH family sporulation protein [Clostridiales bacterium]
MSEISELSFCELRRKDIVSISDGRKLGKIVDLVFSSSTGKVQGIVAPYGRKFLCFRSQEVYIPYCNIKTIGEDIILVDISSGLNQRSRFEGGRGESRIYHNIKQPLPPDNHEHRDNHEHEQHHEHYDHSHDKDCDGRCDKCMLFDCESRWKKQNTVYIDDTPYK